MSLQYSDKVNLMRFCNFCTVSPELLRFQSLHVLKEMHVCRVLKLSMVSSVCTFSMYLKRVNPINRMNCKISVNTLRTK